MAKMFHIMSPGINLAQLDKEYLLSGWTSDSNNWMTYHQEGYLLDHIRILNFWLFWLSHTILKTFNILSPTSYIIELKMKNHILYMKLMEDFALHCDKIKIVHNNFEPFGPQIRGYTLSY